jgi:hypothetical protein
MRRTAIMFENLGVLLPVWLLVTPLVGALVDYAGTPNPTGRHMTGRA